MDHRAGAEDRSRDARDAQLRCYQLGFDDAQRRQFDDVVAREKGEVGAFVRSPVRGGSVSTSARPQSAHRPNPSRYSLWHFGHHLVDTP